MSNSSKIKALCQYIFTSLEHDITVGGKTIPAGTEVLLLPQTTAGSIRVPGNISLAEAWDSLSKEGHSHHDLEAVLSGYQEQLVRYADRLTKLEIWAVGKGYSLPDGAE